MIIKKISASKEIDVRKQIGIFVEKNPDMKVSEMVRVLGLFGIKRSTAYTWVNRLKSGESVDRKPGSGQHRAINQLIRRIKNIIKNSPENLCQNLMRDLKTKVRKAADRGPLSVLN